MIKKEKKYLIISLAIFIATLTFLTSSIAQINPSWSNHEPSGGTGNLVPPHGNGTFVRQDPMPENLQDITIFSSNKNGIKLKVEFPDTFDYEFAKGPDGKTYRRYKASSEFKVIGDTGTPEILNRIICLQIPKDALNIKVSSVKQSFKDTKNEGINLYPIPEIVFEEDDAGLTGSKEVFTINEDLYQKDTIFPETKIQIVEEGFKRDMHLIRLAVPVMIYNPKAAITQEIKTVDVKVTYESQLQKNTISIDTQKDPFHKVFNALIPNYAHHKPKPSGEITQGGIVEIREGALTNPNWAQQNEYFPDYLVIAAKIFDFDENEEAHEQLVNWADHRSGEQGGNYKIAIAYVDEIVDAYPEPGLKEEKIKAFIEMIYQDWRISPHAPNLNFLILIGDADQGGEDLSWFLPTWGSYTNYAGDNNYAWLIGDDTLNDIMIGRLPAKDEEELGTMVSKITNFELNPPQGENHYGTRTLMLYGDKYKKLVTPPEATTATRDLLLSKKQELDEFHTNYLEGLPDFKYNSATVTGILNEDDKGALFVGYNAHGSALGGWGPNVNVFNLTNIEKLPVVVLAQTCSTAQFDLENSDCYAERWIKHEEGGSVCYWGSTRVATDNPQAHTDFYSAVFKSQMTILGSGINLVTERFSMPGADGQRKIFNLLGDPAINFSAYISESTKPDLSQIETIASPEYPSSYNQNMTVSSSFKNNSDHALNNILVKLYSIESNEKYDVASWTCSLPAQGYEDADSTWSYLAESSRHFMTWPDPNDTLDELSEFNNWLNSDIQYYPIHIDTSNNTGIEYGTAQEPFKKLSSGISHAFENDLIGNDDCRPDPWKAVEIHLNDGVYGDGSVIDVGSIILKSEHGAKKTVVLNSITINGSSYHIEGITFKGGNGQNSAFKIRQSENTSQNNDMHMFLRNIFRKWDGYAIDVNQQDFPHPFPQTCHKLKNNVFHDNFGTIYADAKQNLQLFITNNTFANNENNFFLISPLSRDLTNAKKEINLSVRNNIMWNNGETSGAGAFPENIVFFYKTYNNINDNTFWDTFGLDSTNMNADPKFRNSNQSDFHLNSNSPCINAGSYGSSFEDPDGSRNDMGAYGGPEAIIRPIKITYPVHGETIHAIQTPPFQIPLDIKWKAYQLTPNDLVDIEIYHLEYEIMPPDKGNNVPYYHGKKVFDLNVLTENDNIYSTIIEQIVPTRSYWLTMTNHENPEEFEKINFKISSENQSIHNNR